MHSEPAAAPWAVDLAPEPARATPSSSQSSTVHAATPLSAGRRHLTLVPGGAGDEPPVRAAYPATTPLPWPTATDIVVPPMAEPPAAVAASSWSSPAAILDLLASASEHRRVLELIWSAREVGAVQLPPALADAIERARATWPAVLPASS